MLVKMNIKIETITGKEIEIENIQPSDTIYTIKEKFELIEGIPPHQQRYYADGAHLRDDESCENLYEGFKILLVLHHCIPFNHE